MIRQTMIPFMLLIALFFCRCEKEKDKGKGLTYVDTVYGGCNLSSSVKSTMNAEEVDTVMVFMHGDTLTVRVGINYICCARMEDNSVYRNDTLEITISDACTEEDNCYCHCMCYYLFDFRYSDLVRQDYPCRIYFYDALQHKRNVLFEGLIQLKPDR